MPWEFTLASQATLIVLDLFQSIDQFEIFDVTLGSLGVTSAPTLGFQVSGDISAALANPAFSRAHFILGPGDYAITGRQILGTGGTGAFFIDTTAIPLPGAIVLMLTATSIFGGLALRRRGRVN